MGVTVRGLALTHGAGANCEAPLLLRLEEAFTAAGWLVHRYNLPFRRKRPNGPPHPSGGGADREGVREAAAHLRAMGVDQIWMGGHSYGGRQTSMAAAESPGMADGLLLLSYPLHPPDKPEQLRTAHFREVRTPAWFVHGSRDPFGTVEEMQWALTGIPAPTHLEIVQGAGHDLKRTAEFARWVAGLLGA